MVSQSTRSRLPATPRPAAAAQVGELGTILGVWAHPDDEAYLASGVTRLALENGQRVVCVTATSGERGTEEPSILTPRVLGQIRRAELSASLDAVASGLTGNVEHHWLHHRDGEVARADPGTGAGEIAAVIDRVRPDTVLTFDPGGLTGHPDHQAVARWTALAVAATPHVAHLEAVVARSWAEHVGASIDLGDYFGHGYPAVVDDALIDLNLVLDDELWSVKDRTLRAHASQVDGVARALGDELWRAFSITESFRRTGRAEHPIRHATKQQPTRESER